MASHVGLTVRFHLADPAGVLFYGRVFELVQEAYEAFCRENGLAIDAWMRLDGETTPVAHVEADYRAPMRVGERLTAVVTVSRVGRSSFTMSYAFCGPEGDVRATASVVHVHVDAATWAKVPIPGDLRAVLERHRSA